MVPLLQFFFVCASVDSHKAFVLPLFFSYYCINSSVASSIGHPILLSLIINSRALIGEKPCVNKVIHALLMHG